MNDDEIKTLQTGMVQMTDAWVAFKAKYDRWSEVSEEAYHIKVRG